MKSYEYSKLMIPSASKITQIEPMDGDFYDWKDHFQVTIQVSPNVSVKTIHVVLNECNVFNTFFDPKIQTDSFGNTSKCKHLTLGIYATNSIAKAFARIQSKKGRKFDYMYKCKGENFSQRMNQIGAFGKLR